MFEKIQQLFDEAVSKFSKQALLYRMTPKQNSATVEVVSKDLQTLKDFLNDLAQKFTANQYKKDTSSSDHPKFKNADYTVEAIKIESYGNGVRALFTVTPAITNKQNIGEAKSVEKEEFSVSDLYSKILSIFEADFVIVHYLALENPRMLGREGKLGYLFSATFNYPVTRRNDTVRITGRFTLNAGKVSFDKEYKLLGNAAMTSSADDVVKYINDKLKLIPKFNLNEQSLKEYHYGMMIPITFLVYGEDNQPVQGESVMNAVKKLLGKFGEIGYKGKTFVMALNRDGWMALKYFLQYHYKKKAGGLPLNDKYTAVDFELEDGKTFIPYENWDTFEKMVTRQPKQQTV
jgi:hypothetical protein